MVRSFIRSRRILEKIKMPKPIFINQRELSSKKPPYIIAEVSANHHGSLDRAKETIFAAKNAGVDAVKIQTYTPDTMTIESSNPDFWIKDGLWQGHSLYELYAKAQTPFDWHQELFAYAKQINITLFSSPFDESAVDLLESLNTPAYKIASFELVDLPLIQYIAKKKKPMLMSTGMASLAEITEALETAKANGCDEIAIFHCISSYPTPIDQANLNSLFFLRNKFGVQVGLSDHTLGNTASIAATALGATLIEKHFTLSRADGGFDSAFSIEPAEMQSLVQECRQAFSALGNLAFDKSRVDASNKVFRRSLYFVKDVNKGEKITAKNIRRIRPGFGLSPKYYPQILGAKLKKDVKKGDRVQLEDLDLKN